MGRISQSARRVMTSMRPAIIPPRPSPASIRSGSRSITKAAIALDAVIRLIPAMLQRQPISSTDRASGVAPSRLPIAPTPMKKDDSMAKRSGG